MNNLKVNGSPVDGRSDTHVGVVADGQPLQAETHKLRADFETSCPDLCVKAYTFQRCSLTYSICSYNYWQTGLHFKLNQTNFIAQILY